MSNAVYDKAFEKFIQGDIDLLVDDIKAVLVSSTHVRNLAAHEFLSDIAADLIGTGVSLATKTIGAAAFDAADVTFSAVASGQIAGSVVLYKDTGVAGTSPLIQSVDTITGFPYTGTGGDLVVRWSNGAYKILGKG